MAKCRELLLKRLLQDIFRKQMWVLSEKKVCYFLILPLDKSHFITEVEELANRKIMLPQYGTVMKRGVLYYRTRIKDANGKLVALYAKTPEELYNKETLALEQIENATFHRKTPTVAEYCEKWLLMQSVHVRATTLTDYTSKVRRHIIAELGDKRMGEVSLDDIQLALVPVSKKSTSVYKSVVILYKSIFRAAMESRIIEDRKSVV